MSSKKVSPIGVWTRIFGLLTIAIAFSCFFQSRCAFAQGPANLFSRQILESLPARNRVDGLAVVVPVYRELENGNIFRLLASLCDQENPREYGLQDVRVLLWVNNDKGVGDSIVRENVKTIEVLNALRLGIRPNVKNPTPEINEAIDLVLKNRWLKIEVVDRVTVPYQVRSIGKVRADANQHVLSVLFPNVDSHHIVLVQLDADAIVGHDFFRNTYLSFSRTNKDLLLSNLNYIPDRNSGDFIFMLMPIEEHDLLAYELNSMLTSNRALSGTPRISIRSSAYTAVGGFRDMDYGEDHDLVTRHIQAKGADSCLLLPHQNVSVFFRTRSDSYDGSIFLNRGMGRINYKISATSLKNTWRASRFLERSGDRWLQLFRSELNYEMERLKQENKSLKNLILALAHGLEAGEKPSLAQSRMVPSFLNNPLVVNNVIPSIFSVDGNPQKTLERLLAQYPAFLQGPNHPMMKMNIVMRVLIRTIKLISFHREFGEMSELKAELKESCEASMGAEK